MPSHLKSSLWFIFACRPAGETGPGRAGILVDGRERVCCTVRLQGISAASGPLNKLPWTQYRAAACRSTRRAPFARRSGEDGRKFRKKEGEQVDTGCCVTEQAIGFGLEEDAIQGNIGLQARWVSDCSDACPDRGFEDTSRSQLSQVWVCDIKISQLSVCPGWKELRDVLPVRVEPKYSIGEDIQLTPSHSR